MIVDLINIDKWTADKQEALFEIAFNNSQVLYILQDTGVKAFYKSHKVCKCTVALCPDW